MLPLTWSVRWAAPFVPALLACAFFGLDRLGDELEDPFGIEPNDLPLDALARIIQIDLLDALGERPLPPPLQPQGCVLHRAVQPLRVGGVSLLPAFSRSRP